MTFLNYIWFYSNYLTAMSALIILFSGDKHLAWLQLFNMQGIFTGCILLALWLHERLGNADYRQMEIQH